MNVWTDGACSGNPGPGGWAFVIEEDGKELCRGSGGEANTTNNRMELSAAINALTKLKEMGLTTVTLITDSQYVQNGITQWINGWVRKAWKGVKNPDLWQRLMQLDKDLRIDWQWTRGHSGTEFNEICDKLAVSERDKASNSGGDDAK